VTLTNLIPEMIYLTWGELFIDKSRRRLHRSN